MFKKKKEEVKTEEDLKAYKPPVLDTVKIEEKKEDLRELIEKNIKWTQVVYEQNRQIKNRLTLIAIGSYIKILIIVVPIVLAFVFLPSIIKQLMSQYGSFFGNSASTSQNQMQELLKLINR